MVEKVRTVEVSDGVRFSVDESVRKVEVSDGVRWIKAENDVIKSEKEEDVMKTTRLILFETAVTFPTAWSEVKWWRLSVKVSGGVMVENVRNVEVSDGMTCYSKPPPRHYDFIVKYPTTVGYVTKHPYLDVFLDYLNTLNFEIIIFTASKKSYASPLLDILDPKGLISYRLYRDSCRYYFGELVKDLSRMRRDLNNVVIIDDNPSFTSFQPKNAIWIKPFYGNLQDRELKYLGIKFFRTCCQFKNVKYAVESYHTKLKYNW
ncbi:haloacid dehalogenase-like hydrolase (HAD) superfamily protein [Artemisia annua]|uniref:Mitochondrial import inner membrane translocase subunit TIM50 n=1 Tax=Artemisia annua TaxID=35608 RepID=A0A2U1KIK1_ARTAN|nr:haloacid dehalogenase-like hydrolase (HAD) superfamily protein [Artemisia annua]